MEFPHFAHFSQLNKRAQTPVSKPYLRNARGRPKNPLKRFGTPVLGRKVSRESNEENVLAQVSHKLENEAMSTPPPPSPSMERSRRHRQRRRRGTRCITVDVNEGEVAALVARGYLPEEARGDPAAIKAAIEGVISDLAFELEQERSKGSGSRF
jgi:hypothetical protein